MDGLIGRVFDDRYEVIRKLGSGGMAEVYLANDRTLGRQVALKVLSTRYANGVHMTIAGGHKDIRSGTKWIGEDGWVWVDRGGIDAYPKSLLNYHFGSNDRRLYRSPGHCRNFLDCVRSRALTITPAEVAHRSATPGHLGQIAMLLGRKLYFDPEREVILNDPTANAMLGNSLRSPWKL